MSLVTTHVLDTAFGRPATGVAVTLITATGGETVGTAVTDEDGRARDLGPDTLEPGVYQLRFDVAAYHAATGQPGFFPTVWITFQLDDPTVHHHVPLLLSPYAYSTYRGS